MSDPILRICQSGVSNSQNLLSRPFPLIPGTQGDSVRLSEVREKNNKICPTLVETMHFIIIW